MIRQGIKDFAELRLRYPTRSAAFPPDIAHPTTAEIEALERKFGCTFPPSFVQFQTVECLTTPMGASANAFGWATSKVDPHMRLETILQSAKEWGVPQGLLAFLEDEGTFLCFATNERDETGESPVVTWDHDERGVLAECRWPTFLCWLADDLEETCGHRRA